MSLSDRIRPDTEAAPWVIEEIKKLEAKVVDLEKDEKMFLNEHDENVRLHFENVELKEQNTRLREALEFTISAADYLYKTESPVPRGLAPMFYHSLSYEGDVELVEKTKKARAALEGK
jgi:hypothetical protein